MDLSAIVVLVEDEVDQVYIVPSEQANFDNLDLLRTKVRAAGVEDVKIQHVPYAGVNSPFATIEEVARQLAALLDNRKIGNY